MPKKLALKCEDLRVLTPDQLSSIAGGELCPTVSTPTYEGTPAMVRNDADLARYRAIREENFERYRRAGIPAPKDSCDYVRNRDKLGYRFLPGQSDSD
jgi:hypothetical protein